MNILTKQNIQQNKTPKHFLFWPKLFSFRYFVWNTETYSNLRNIFQWNIPWEKSAKLFVWKWNSSFTHTGCGPGQEAIGPLGLAVPLFRGDRALLRGHPVQQGLQEPWWPRDLRHHDRAPRDHDGAGEPASRWQHRQEAPLERSIVFVFSYLRLNSLGNRYSLNAQD